MLDFLTEMSNASLVRARSTRERVGVATLEARAASAPSPIQLNLSPAGFDLIAEAKLSSPTTGPLVDTSAAGTVALAEAYQLGGACAVSVLTEDSRFNGSMAHLAAAVEGVGVPVMRKDFLVDPLQVLEARAAGASGVLLIARLLEGSLLTEMTDLVLSLGMFALVEVFDASDMEQAGKVFDRQVLVGVNCRDLSNLAVDFQRLSSIAPHLPKHLPLVAESGISSPDDVAAVAALGYRLALVGSSLVTAADPAGLVREMVAAGRSAHAEVGA